MHAHPGTLTGLHLKNPLPHLQQQLPHHDLGMGNLLSAASCTSD